MTVAELTRVRIERLHRDPDDLYSAEWVEVDDFPTDARFATNVVLSTWLHEELDEDSPSGLYRAVLSDGRRSDEVHWSPPTAHRRAA